MKGKKEYMKGYYISLKESTTNVKALLNKIDIYVWVNNKYLEVTNVYTFDIPSKIEGMKREMLQNLYLDPPNYVKALKRAYSAARVDNNPIIERIHPFLNSNYNLLYSATTDLDVLKTILEFGYKLTTLEEKRFRITLGTVINKLSYFYMEDINEFINLIQQLYDNFLKIDEGMIIEILEEIIMGLRIITNNGALIYMKYNNINLAKELRP